MADRDIIPIWFLLQCLTYDPKTGILRWKERPRSHFLDEKAQHTWNTRYAHTEAGYIRKDNGYRLLVISINDRVRTIYASRAAWAMMKGEYPPFEIDHRDGDRANNRFENLRPATKFEQMQNVAAHKDSRTGLLGVAFETKTGRPYARICVGGRTKRLGTFDTPEEAHAAYLKAKSELHPFQPIPR